MGHVAITTRDRWAPRLLPHLLDSRVSDLIDEKIGPLSSRSDSCARRAAPLGRHRQRAGAAKVDPFRTKAQHINIQAASLEDMVAAYQRVQDLGFRMAWDVGQHTNDRALSFYCVTPSDFQLEVGWDPVIVAPEQEATWEPTTYQGISIWGHTLVGETVITKLHQFKTALRSTRHEEATVPELSGAVQ